VYASDVVEINSNSIEVGGDRYKITFCDNFNDKSTFEKYWDHRATGKRREAYNVTDLVELSEGNLILKTEKQGNKIRTSMIGTQETFYQKYGYFVINAKLQKTDGNWSAFWLQSPTIGAVKDDLVESGAEIDVFEKFSTVNKRIRHNIHWNGYQEHHENQPMDTYIDESIDLVNEFHTYGLRWTPKSYEFYIDGKLVQKTTKAISHKEQYMIISLEVGNKEKSFIDKHDQFSDEILVDYVKVYQEESILQAKLDDSSEIIIPDEQIPLGFTMIRQDAIALEELVERDVTIANRKLGLNNRIILVLILTFLLAFYILCYKNKYANYYKT